MKIGKLAILIALLISLNPILSYFQFVEKLRYKKECYRSVWMSLQNKPLKLAVICNGPEVLIFEPEFSDMPVNIYTSSQLNLTGREPYVILASPTDPI